MDITTPYITTRPRHVTTATWLLYAMAAASLIFGLIPVALMDDLKRAAEHAYAGTYLAGTAANEAVSSAGTGLLGGLVSAAFWSALAFFCARGKNVARIIVWICAGGLTLNLLLGISVLPKGFFAERPDWYLPMFVASATIRLIGLAAISVLLGMPSSRPFFRKPLSPTTAQGAEPTT